MKYLIQSIKYIKSNFLMMLPSVIIAMLAFAPILDYSAAEKIIQSYSGGVISDSFIDWFKLFIPFNSRDVWTILLSIAAYVALVLNVAFTHSMVDKHVRFGSKTFRSILSSFTINFIYGLITITVIFVVVILLALVMAGIMKTFALIGAYMFIVGAAICAVIAILLIFLAAHMFLWLPCAEITGFKMSEAFFTSYAQARTVRWRNFVAIGLPLALAVVIISLCGAFLGTIGAIVAGGICFGWAYILIMLSSYMAYADVEGIVREDLKKY